MKMKASVTPILGAALAVVLVFFSGVAVAGIPTPTENWFDQTIDHFNIETQPATFRQRYLTFSNYWSSANHGGELRRGPIFFYTGNEGDITAFWDNSGFVFELAKSYGALVVFGEHRYYGKTYPFGSGGPDSYSKEHIGYLSVEQALADYATLIEHLKSTLPGASHSPVIAFGGSYGGMLSAWFRMKYPQVVDGALAASAPILWSTNVSSATTGPDSKRPPGYFETVTNDFRAADERCPGLVQQAFAKMLQLAQTPSGLAAIAKQFSLCKNVLPHEVEHLILWVVNAFGNMAMMDYPYPTGFMAPLPAYPIKVACHLMLNNTDDVLRGLAQAAGLYYNSSSPLQCFNIWDEFVECADQTGCGTGPAGQSWDYQACGEIVYYPNTNNVTDMFPPRDWTLADLNAHCQRTWGITPRPTWLKTYTGGENIRYASRIIFSNGLLDPWHGGGFLESLSDSLIAIIIKDGAHHLDLRSSDPRDPPSVVEARNHEARIIGKWLAELQA